MKLQEDINEQHDKVKKLNEENTLLVKKIEEKERGTLMHTSILLDLECESIKTDFEQVKELLKSQTAVKDTLLLELTSKAQQCISVEQEKAGLMEEVKRQQDKVRDSQAQQEQTVAEGSIIKKRVELLEATLRDNASQLLIQQHQQKEVNTEVNYSNCSTKLTVKRWKI